MSHRDLVEAFERCELEAVSFGHREHVQVAWMYLRTMPPAEALGQFSRCLRRFAEHHGAQHKYHETITWAFVALVNERMERGGRETPWEIFAERNPDVLDKRVLSQFYQPHVLGSELARRVFLLPRHTD